MTAAASVTERLRPERSLVRTARRELALLITATAALFGIAAMLNRSTLTRRGPWGRVDSWTYGPPEVTALRVLRVLLQFGSAALLLWLAFLLLLCVPQRPRRSTVLARLPFGTFVRRAVIGTIVLGVAGSSGNAAFASSRPAVVANDATGGQRWPDLVPRAARPLLTTSPIMLTPSATSGHEVTSGPPIAIAHTADQPTTARTADPSPLAGPELISSPSAFVAGPAAIVFATGSLGRPAEANERERVVRAGESFWSIAEDVVLTNVDEATDTDVADYWRRLIDRNQARLPDPNNPDLLWVGTVLRLPADV